MKLSPRRRLFALVTVWAVLLAGLAFLWPDGSPTVREQVTVGESRPDIEAAVAAAVTAASGYDDAVFTVGAFAKEADCSLTPVRGGVVYAQVVALYARPENAKSVLNRLFETLREPYDLVGNGEGAYLGYAGPFVTAELSLADDMAVTWRLNTGCRPLDEPTAQLATVGVPSEAAASVAATLGLAGGRWTRTGGGCAETVTTASAAPGAAGVAVTADAVTRAAEGGWVTYAGPEGAPTWHVGVGADGAATVLAWDAEDGVARVNGTVGRGCA
ncbi:hypothetical protein [Phytomonospora endophytica]|uniref:Uncharacterized protein n=1 Tax=Phytomonospora endophytica TaxID=714109 RepID=A0A841FM86_9ACTN|nr:hypothetical protein [Phytomonospora endophytica]MBB6036023.1 hypothetical protein [Phytomonospora endophytica]GIG66928.1 hypothetical protein Pen01_32230 [Phytomonospora endophytica]